MCGVLYTHTYAGIYVCVFLYFYNVCFYMRPVLVCVLCVVCCVCACVVCARRRARKARPESVNSFIDLSEKPNQK